MIGMWEDEQGTDVIRKSNSWKLIQNVQLCTTEAIQREKLMKERNLVQFSRIYEVNRQAWVDMGRIGRGNCVAPSYYGRYYKVVVGRSVDRVQGRIPCVLRWMAKRRRKSHPKKQFRMQSRET